MTAPLALRLLAVPVAAATVVAGLWVTGGLITDDFALAMWLTVAWMAAAGVAALAIARRSSAFRWPVLGAYLVTALAVGAYLAPSQLFDKEVNERVATGPARAAGVFEPVRHDAEGDARAVGDQLTLTGFEVDNGPDLRVYLVAGPAQGEEEVDDFVDLGGLKGNKGNQQYRIPAGTDLDRYSTVVIWCRAFSVLFARARLA
jgi:hypothetical protein